MADAPHARRSALSVVISWLALLWTVFLVDALSGWKLAINGGLYPGDLHRWWGILTAHFLHASPQHLVANSVALLMLGTLSASISVRLTGLAVIHAMIGAGVLAFLFAEPGMPHIGASGVVFGLIGFTLLLGILRPGCRTLTVAILVFLLFGGALWTLHPSTFDDQQVRLISWQMHLGGFIGGALAAIYLRREPLGNRGEAPSARAD